MKSYFLSSLIYLSTIVTTGSFVNSCTSLQRFDDKSKMLNNSLDNYFMEGKDSLLTAQFQIYKIELDLKNKENTKILYDCKTNKVDKVTMFEQGIKKEFFSSDTLENDLSKEIILRSHKFIYEFFGIKKNDSPIMKLFKIMPGRIYQREEPKDTVKISPLKYKYS